ncbi:MULTISPECIES: DUF6316 family protein [Pseudomonas]|jgi:hypothetical protein|uniref:DUF6316 family protein n=1 Tax=Pseudomonas TaxID=286 RepID=UPI001C810F52|nr:MULTISPECIES: DUF6316 family protein [Pseudomonas]MDG9928850.1 DUF6316 family protein [Pseudomonas sp. GD04042]MDH0484334.1 DUF6316 family protein [Pseudomonas sp. GD04015]MDH0604176.1 DUF6316 family protein [Pseudomonas sp. GD03869]MDH0896828.1 DUF6316 family protein [Pseudomonas sp. GD03875]MDH1066646.1 DUF6316 family protein [Pseudomonas sp. GD03985]
MYGQRRIDPAPGTHYRSERISAVNGQYFFATREGTLEGPFFTRIDAEHGIDSYVQRMKQADDILETRVG